MANDPKPITLTQVDVGSYTGLTPQPYILVGDPLADPVASDADVAVLVADAGSDTRVALDLVYTPIAVTDEDVEALVENEASATRLALDVLYDFATIATGITGYSAGATQTLKHVTGTLTWVTDGA